MILEEFPEIFSCHAHVNVIIYLYGNTDSVALSDAEATRKNYVVGNAVFLDSTLKKLNDLLRSLEVAGGSYANLYDNHITLP